MFWKDEWIPKFFLGAAYLFVGMAAVALFTLGLVSKNGYEKASFIVAGLGFASTLFLSYMEHWHRKALPLFTSGEANGDRVVDVRRDVGLENPCGEGELAAPAPFDRRDLGEEPHAHLTIRCRNLREVTPAQDPHPDDVSRLWHIVFLLTYLLLLLYQQRKLKRRSNAEYAAKQAR
jgi:hypothetical protein